MVTPIRDILKTTVRAWGLERAARLGAAQASWSSIAGPALAAASAPVALRGRRLYVGVTNSTVGQEVRLRQSALVQAVNRALGEEVVADVVPVARRRLPGREDHRSGRRGRQDQPGARGRPRPGILRPRE